MSIRLGLALVVAVGLVVGYLIATSGGGPTTIPHLTSVPTNMATGPRFHHVYCGAYPHSPECP